MKWIACFALLANYLIYPGCAIAVDSNHPRMADDDTPYVTPITPMDLRNVPDFAASATSSKAQRSALQAGLQSTTLPTSTHMKLVVEYAVDAKTSQPGDIFEAHVADDLFLGQSLLLPRGSLVRGRVVEVNKPRWISRAGKIGLRLEQIVTPSGETVPLDAALEFRQGVTNQRGDLDPGTNFATRVESDLASVTGFKSKGPARGALIAANIATLGAPAVATLIGSSAIALFREGDNMSLQPGQVLEVLLTNDLGLQIN